MVVFLWDRPVENRVQAYRKVDGTTATLCIDYAIKGMIRGVNRVVREGNSEQHNRG